MIHDTKRWRNSNASSRLSKQRSPGSRKRSRFAGKFSSARVADSADQRANGAKEGTDDRRGDVILKERTRTYAAVKRRIKSQIVEVS